MSLYEGAKMSVSVDFDLSEEFDVKLWMQKQLFSHSFLQWRLMLSLSW